ncbi:MAG: hypothetical protein K0V04_01345 [Deltaproteobacteria bacterium]|nr:hypothetical protein [Deltaproteobacteria bacterium]
MLALGALLTVSGSGCGDDAAADPTRDDAGSGGEDEGPPRPSFAEPASGRLDLRSNRIDDLQLMVTGIVPGKTELVIDEQGLGTLHDQSTVGRLNMGSLQVFVRGSLVPGEHRMLLRNSDSSGTSDSEIIEMLISSELNQLPTATLDQDVELAGHRLLVMGHDANALLLVMELTDGVPRLHMVPLDASGWAPAQARTVSLPGLDLDPSERVLPVAAVRRGRSADDAGRVRVAWRAGRPGASIDLIDTPWDDASPEVEPVASLTAEQALGDHSAQWSELGRPWLVDDQLLAELYAPIDVESARPGDRALVSTRILDDATSLDPTQRITIGGATVDLDALGPAIDRIAAEGGRPPPVSIRADQHRALALEHDPGTGVFRVRLSNLEDEDRALSFLDLPLVSVIGAFGSRTVAGLSFSSGSGRMQIATHDDLGPGGIDVASLGDSDVPSLGDITGELAPASVDGLTVFLLPFGALQPVQAVHSAGGAAMVEPLEQLRCDSIAVAPFVDKTNTLSLACARDGEVRLGTLSTVALR